MKAIQDFEVFVNKNNDRVPHYSGSSIEGKKKLAIKKGEDIPKEVASDILQFNRDFVDLKTVTDEERTKVKKPAPKIVPRGYSQESLTKLINSFGKHKEDALDALRLILEKDFSYKSRSRRLGFLRNKILSLQEKKRRGG